MKRSALAGSRDDLHRNRRPRIDFHVAVRAGDLVDLVARVVATGRTSLTVEVALFSENLLTGARQLCTRGRVVLVALDIDGRPTPVLPLESK